MRDIDGFSDRAVRGLVPLTTALLLVVTLGLAGLNKLMSGGVPGFFTERFGGTFLASFPGIPASYYSIAILEAVIGLVALASVLKGEWLGRRTMPVLKLALGLSLVIFLQLGFGLRLVQDNDGAHNLFMYFAGTLVALLAVEWLERKAEAVPV